MRGANDVIFSIAYAKGGGQGNPRVGAVQSGMYRLNQGPLWAEGQINSTNDRYVIRDASGKPTGQEVRFSDQHGVVKGAEGQWTPVGSWGGNKRAGIVGGQPTAAPPPSGNTPVPIVDLDAPGGRILSPVLGGTPTQGQYDPQGRTIYTGTPGPSYAPPGGGYGGGYQQPGGLLGYG